MPGSIQPGDHVHRGRGPDVREDLAVRAADLGDVAGVDHEPPGADHVAQSESGVCQACSALRKAIFVWV